MKNCRDWAFSNSGLEAGLPASLSAEDVGKMWCTAEKRLIYAICLFKESMFLWKSNLALYQKLEVPESCSTLHKLIMVASCLQKIELWYPSFRLQTIDCDLGLFYTATAASQWRILEIELLATVGWKQRCQPAFQLKMLAKCDALPKRDLCRFMRHVCLRNPCFCGNLTLHSTRSLRSLRAAARSTNSLWLNHACKR